MSQKNLRLGALRMAALSEGIRKCREIKKPVELIVRADSRRSWLARELGRVGQVTHVYEHIPYLSFRCDGADAYALSQVFHRASDERAYRAVASAVSAIDFSGGFSIPKVTKHAEVVDDVWNLEDIGAYVAQGFGSGEGVKVAVIDTGVNYNHGEVRGCFGALKGYDFVLSSDAPMDLNGHGTHVAGIVLGANYGVASGAGCFALRVLDETGSGNEADAIAALDWAAGHGVDVVNMSFGSPHASSALEDMCYYLADKGVLVVAAAGNDGVGASYPAAFGDSVIAVAAVDRGNRHADFSNVYGTNDISAPGVAITSSYLDGYATLSGTSMAAPHVSGSLALVLSVARSGASLEDVMERTALNLGGGRDVYGAGLVRVDRMVEAVSQLRQRPLKSYGAEAVHALKEVLWK